jgi:hypothetical protein
MVNETFESGCPLNVPTVVELLGVGDGRADGEQGRAGADGEGDQRPD